MTAADRIGGRVRSSPRARVIVHSWRSALCMLRRPLHVPEVAAIDALTRSQPDVVVDVGANVGQFATSLRARGYSGRLLSLEPLSTPFDALKLLASGDPLWLTRQLALGESESSRQMHVSGNAGLSSSLLTMTDEHLGAFPTSRTVASEGVRMSTLARVMTEVGWQDSHGIFVKIDTQGYERQVLEGCLPLLDRISGLLIETSIAPLYQGSWTVADAFAWLRRHGFDIDQVVPGVMSPAGRMLQMDLLAFSRRRHVT